MRVIFHGRRALLGSALMLLFDWDAEPLKKHEDEETEWIGKRTANPIREGDGRVWKHEKKPTAFANFQFALRLGLAALA